MPIDAQKLNTVYNQLKELVGSQGAFAIFCSKGVGDSDEEIEVRTFGPQTRQIGLLDTCVPVTRENIVRSFNGRLKRKPQEPD
jgi:hypothetical protein